MTSFDLVMESEACEGESEEQVSKHMMELNRKVRKIAADNGYCFNSHHHDDEILGLPYVYDFYIEIADIDKNIAWINRAFQNKMKLALIEQEYGIYDEKRTA